MTQYQRPQFQSGTNTPSTSAPSPQPDYLKSGYFDPNGNIRCELLTSQAEAKAKELGNAGITSTQLRAFFIQVRSIERELETKEFKQVAHLLQRLEPMVANYVGRGKNPYERQDRQKLKQFIDSNVREATKDLHGFTKGFVPHFEAVVAYFKYNFPTK